MYRCIHVGSTNISHAHTHKWQFGLVVTAQSQSYSTGTSGLVSTLMGDRS